MIYVLFRMIKINIYVISFLKTCDFGYIVENIELNLSEIVVLII